MGARPYDSATGRFLSGDPVEGGSSNFYDYVDQNPLNESDPDGTNGGPPCAPGTQACKKYLKRIYPGCSNGCPSSLDINLTIAAGKFGDLPIGFTVGVQIGSGGVAPYWGGAYGGGVHLSVTGSPSSVNRGSYNAYGACVGPLIEPVSGCGGYNSRGNVSSGIGIGIGGDVQRRHPFPSISSLIP